MECKGLRKGLKAIAGKAMLALDLRRTLVDVDYVVSAVGDYMAGLNKEVCCAPW